MQLMQLEMFVAVCEEKSFSRAAESLSRTNAAVTLAIVKLEKEVGTRLIARSRRAVHHPTKAGELVYEYASQILGLRDDLRIAFDGAQTGRTKTFRIGISTSVKWMSPLVESFRRKYPQVRMEICYGPPNVLCQEVQDAKIDFAIVPNEISLADLGSSLMLIPVSCPIHPASRQYSHGWSNVASFGLTVEECLRRKSLRLSWIRRSYPSPLSSERA